MLQRSLPTTSTVEIANSLQRTLDRRWLRSLQDLLPLPETWQQYLVLLAIVLIVAGGFCLQILLAVQTAQAEYQVRQLHTEYANIQRANSDLIFQIASQSGLLKIEQLARAQGYMAATGRTYVRRDQLTAVATSADALLANRQTAGVAAADTVPKADATAGSPADWLTQSRQWVQRTQESAQTTVTQFMGDLFGRVR